MGHASYMEISSSLYLSSLSLSQLREISRFWFQNQKGDLSVSEFLLTRDNLISKCPTWSWLAIKFEFLLMNVNSKYRFLVFEGCEFCSYTIWVSCKLDRRGIQWMSISKNPSIGTQKCWCLLTKLLITI